VEIGHHNASYTFENPLQGRELFPDSDCLKSSQREHMLFKEILSADADILCLQVRNTHTDYAISHMLICTRYLRRLTV
jgi:hypothetical protein